jgi:diguanylate cyclase (GGDEF)-like protein
MGLRIERVLGALENRSRLFCVVTGLAGIGLVGLADYLTGNEISFSLFYLVPILLIAWCGNQNTGFLLALASALTQLGAELAGGRSYTEPSIYLWNTLIRGSLYLSIAYLVAQLHRYHGEIELAARTDFVTGVANRRSFSETLHAEVARIARYPHPFTLVYMDIDNFKMVNDLYGHQGGDDMLRSIAMELKSQLRSTDTVARVGGDEFSLLLPSTGQPQAGVVVQKVRDSLVDLMARRRWPTTMSMGVVTCTAPPQSADQITNMADELMYAVKSSHKNDALFVIWDGKDFKKY